MDEKTPEQDEDEKKKVEPSLKDKFSEHFNKEKFKEHFNKEKMESLYGYAKENTLDTIAYILLIVGLVLIFFKPFYGEILVGIVFGYYFSDEIIRFFNKWQKFVDKQGLVKSIIFGGTALAFFILAPLIFIAAAIISGLKYLILSESEKTK